jgi:hypothetical protein
MGAIYKLVEIEDAGGKPRFTAKHSPEKQTLAGAKQLFRYENHDLLALHDDCASGAEAMLKPYVLGGNLITEMPSLDCIRQRAAAAMNPWPPPGRQTKLSLALESLNESLLRH